MKVWFSHGSEHSMNLVLIGTFAELADRQKAEELLRNLTDKVRAAEVTEIKKFSDEMLTFLSESNFFHLRPEELEAFIYSYRQKTEGNQIVITTEEADWAAFAKILVRYGARVEIFSAHDYKDTKHGR